MYLSFRDGKEEDEERHNEDHCPGIPEDERDGGPASDQPGDDIPDVRGNRYQGRPVGGLLVPEQGPLHAGTQPVTDDVEVEGDDEENEREDGGNTPIGREIHYPIISPPCDMMVAGLSPLPGYSSKFANRSLTLPGIHREMHQRERDGVVQHGICLNTFWWECTVTVSCPISWAMCM